MILSGDLREDQDGQVSLAELWYIRCMMSTGCSGSHQPSLLFLSASQAPTHRLLSVVISTHQA